MLNLYVRYSLAKLAVARKLKDFRDNQNGATAIEYGLIAALISVAIIGAVKTLGNNLGTTFNNVAGNLSQ